MTDIVSNFQPLKTKCCKAEFETIHSNFRTLDGNRLVSYRCLVCGKRASIYYDNSK